MAMQLQSRVATVPVAVLVLLVAARARAVETVMVPSLDGTLLATDIYRADDAPRPVMILRTANGKDAFASWGAAAETSGDSVRVVQDWRGTGDSQGKKGEGWFYGADDGHALLQFIAKQPWSNGHVTMTGASHVGIAQYVAAPGADASLVGISPSFATGDLLRHGFFQGGVLHADPASAFGPEGVRTIIGQVADSSWPAWDEYVNSPVWAKYLVDDAQAASVHAVGLHHGGFFDLFVQGTLDSFARIQDSGGAQAKGRQKIVMGPWTHGGNGATVGELTFPASATLAASPYPGLAAAWTTGSFTGDWSAWDAAPSVHVYVMGDAGDPNGPGNTWRSYAAWPPPATVLPVYLTADGHLAAAADAGEASFASDPSDPCPAIGGTNNLVEEAGPYDQRAVVESRKDVLVFTSGVTPYAAEIVGRISAEIWISTDVPDVDLAVRMTDVYPDGRSMLMAQGIQRARYRDGTCPALLSGSQPVRIKVDMLSTALALAPGHAIRVIVSASADPLYAVNPQNGESFVGKTPNAVATIKVLTGGATASALLLPFVSYDGTPLKTNEPVAWVEPSVEPCASDGGGGGSGSTSASGSGGSGGREEGAREGNPTPGARAGEDSGCGCRTSAPGPCGPLAVVGVVLAAGVHRRRRRSPEREP